MSEFFKILKPDVFTPLTRTPWAGQKIYEFYKKKFDINQSLIGEAWEFSSDSQFPSLLASDPNKTLEELIRASLPNGYEQRHQLLVKLINADEALSIQVHPADDSKLLGSKESGKPEAWYVIHSDPGAGVYLGLKPGVSHTEFAEALSQGCDKEIAEKMNFLPCSQGDFFIIEPGLLHSLGPGVLVIEPQGVSPNRHGVTYRVWDWGRLYDKNGQKDQENGSPRELHLEKALACLDLNKQPISFKSNLSQLGLAKFPQSSFGEFYRLHLGGTGKATHLELKSKYAHVFVEEGSCVIETPNEFLTMSEGQSACWLPSRCQFSAKDNRLSLLISTIGFEGIHET